MRSTEKHGATVEEATASALAELGVGRDEADVEVVTAPRRGLFGGSRKAVVRARARAQASVGTRGEAPAEAERTTAGSGSRSLAGERSAERSDDDDTPAQAQGDNEEAVVTDTAQVNTEEPDELTPESELTPEDEVALLDEECELAADFVEGLLDLLDLPGDIEIEVSEETAVVNVSDVGSGLLIGRRGATLDALQELVRSSTQRQTERRSHVRVDVEGYRARHLDKLRTKCRDAVAEVRETGEAHRLEPMDAYERKMMHDLVARTGGVTSSSEGAEPKRRVVILPE
jgi:spoIIIJ-associated protein